MKAWHEQDNFWAKWAPHSISQATLGKYARGSDKHRFFAKN